MKVPALKVSNCMPIWMYNGWITFSWMHNNCKSFPINSNLLEVIYAACMSLDNELVNYWYFHYTVIQFVWTYIVCILYIYRGLYHHHSQEISCNLITTYRIYMLISPVWHALSRLHLIYNKLIKPYLQVPWKLFLYHYR